MTPLNDPADYIEHARSLNINHKYEEAIKACNSALALDPDSADALLERSGAWIKLNKFELALADLETATFIKPGLRFVADTELYVRAWICRWHEYDEKLASLLRRLEAGLVVRPFNILALPSHPSQQLKAATNFFLDSAPSADNGVVASTLPSDGRIRLGYFSADFRDHAIAHLINGVFEKHDRSRFEVIAFSLGGPTDRVRQLMIELSDTLIDVSAMSDDEIVSLARQMEIHVGIDMNVYLDRQPNIFAKRIAPIQVNYLGYPGTAGANCYDYIIGDRIVTPTEHSKFFTERIVTMPHSYQANMFSRYTVFRSFARQELDLPNQGFVFCSFNLSFKISPDVFDVWMRLLTKVEGSVLWLLSSNPTTECNLKQEAQNRNVSPDRLIFAERMPMADHLARHCAADLFLDTFHYGGHTTTSDALWAGLPVVTRLGETFAGRVAASLLSAAGLPDLIAKNSSDYEKLALELAASPEMLTQARNRLNKNKWSCPLFDTARYTRNLESAFTLMWEKYETGAPPENITIVEE